MTREEVEAGYGQPNLWICDTCALVYPPPSDEDSFAGWCDYCDGAILDRSDRTTIATLADQLETIRVALL